MADDTNTADVAANAILSATDKTLRALSELLKQSTQPQFKDLPSSSGSSREDAKEFFSKFNMMTYRFNSLDKCIGLHYALRGSALCWLKSTFKKEIDEGKWDEVKTGFKKRYHPTHRSTYIQQLHDMHFEPSRQTLASYLDDYIVVYSTVDTDKDGRVNFSDTDIIEHFYSSLPPRTRRELSLLANIPNLKTIEELREIIRRQEAIAGEDSEPETKNNAASLAEMLKDLSKNISNDLDSKLSAKIEEKLKVVKVAAAKVEEQPGNSGYNRRNNVAQHDQKRPRYHGHNRYRQRDNYQSHNWHRKDHIDSSPRRYHHNQQYQYRERPRHEADHGYGHKRLLPIEAC